MGKGRSKAPPPLPEKASESARRVGTGAQADLKRRRGFRSTLFAGGLEQNEEGGRTLFGG